MADLHKLGELLRKLQQDLKGTGFKMREYEGVLCGPEWDYRTGKWTTNQVCVFEPDEESGNKN